MRLNPLLYSFLLSLTFIGCKKDLQVIKNSESELINEAQSYFSEFLSNDADKSNSCFQKTDRTGISKYPIWAKASIVMFKNRRAIIVPVKYNTPVLIHSNFGKNNFYKLDDLSKLLVYWDDEGKVRAQCLTYFPDGENLNSFVGILSVETWAGKPIAKYRYENDGKVSVYMESHKQVIVGSSIATRSIQEKKAGIYNNVTICYESSGVNYSPVTGEYYYWTESLGCSNYYFPEDEDKGAPLPDEGGYADDPGGDPGGGLGGYGAYAEDPTPIELLTTVGPVDPVNISQELACFDMKSQAQYYVSINVNQPFPGTRTKLNPFVERKVGHVYLSMTQLNSDNSLVTRNVGFYPENLAKVGKPIDESVFGNDSNTPYTVALMVEVSELEFQVIKQTLINAASDMYDLNNYNCVDVAVNVFETINVHLPMTVGTINAPVTIPGTPDVLFQGLNPADLGEDIRNLDEMTFRNQNAGRFIYIERYTGNSVRRTRDGVCP